MGLVLTQGSVCLMYVCSKCSFQYSRHVIDRAVTEYIGRITVPQGQKESSGRIMGGDSHDSS